MIQIQIISTSFLLFIITVALLVNEFQSLKTRMFENIQTTGQILSRNLSTSLSFIDKDEASRLLQNLKAVKHLVNAQVMLPNGDEFVEINLSSKFANISFDYEKVGDKNYFIDQDKIEFTFDIKEGTEKLGKLGLGLDIIILKKVFYYYFTLFILTSFFGLIFCFILANIFQKKISGPILTIQNTLKRISKEEDYSIELTKVLKSRKFLNIEEISYFAATFDRLLDQVHNSKEYLEKIIREKTAELEVEKEKSIQSAKLATLGEMAAGIAHEINNPLTVIQNNSNVIRRLIQKKDFENPRLTKLSQKIEKTVLRIAKIIRHMKHISRDGSQDPMEKIYLNDLISETIDFTLEKFKKGSTPLIINDFPNSLFFFGRNVQLSQVLLNLLNNAYDAVCDLDESWVEIDANEIKNFIEITVTDSGKGIPPEIQEKILTPFFTTKEVGKGTGIGLSISRKIIAEHGGELYIDNNCKNTRFVIKLPKKEIE